MLPNNMHAWLLAIGARTLILEGKLGGRQVSEAL